MVRGQYLNSFTNGQLKSPYLFGEKNMNCYNCGKEINIQDRFCYHCGASQPAHTTLNEEEQNTQNATTKRTSSSISFNALWYATIGFILLQVSPIVSLIISCFGLKNAKDKDCTQDKLLGKVLNITLICVSILYLILTVVQTSIALLNGTSII